MIQLQADSIGADALKLSATGQPAQVNGITSRGIFLLTQDHQVIFISFEGWRGPWTVNLSDDKSLEKPGPADKASSSFRFLNQRISIGTRISLQPKQILFPSEDIKIDFENLAAWHDIPSSDGNLDWPMIGSRLKKVIGIFSSKDAGNGWTGLLNLPRYGKREIPQNLIEVDDILRTDFTEMIISGRYTLEDRFDRILGRGPGLTPSGDDVVVGLLLAFRRGVFLRTPDHLNNFAGYIVGLARQMTTSLSSCLIASAANGQADERLVSALDGILFGNLDVEECAACLLAYGSSSGGDSLLGMYTALKENSQ